MRAYWLLVTQVLIGCKHLINQATATDRVMGGQDAEAGLVKERFQLDSKKETMAQTAVINALKITLYDPLTLIGWGATKLPTTILQRLDTGAEWNPISLDECRNLNNPVQPHSGDLCIKASAPGISVKSAGPGDSGGPLYITHKKRVPERMVTVAGVTSRINIPLLAKDESQTSVFVDVACYATWIQEQCKKLDTESDCTFNAVPQPKEEVCPDAGNSASHLKSSVITLLIYILFLIAKKISMNSFQ